MRSHPPHLHYSHDRELEKPEEVKPKEFTKRIVYEFGKKRKETIQSAKTYFRLLHYVRPYWGIELRIQRSRLKFFTFA